MCEGTLRAYDTMRRRVESISHIEVDKIKPIQIERIYAELYDRGVTTSIKGLSSFFEGLYKFAIANKYATVNIAEYARVPRVTKHSRRVLTEDERSALLKAFEVFNDFEKAYVGIAYYAGLRRNEILALTMDDIDFDNQTITVNKTLIRVEKGRTAVQQHPTKV